MSFSSGMVWEVRSTASDSNGGGFRGGSALSTPSAPAVSGSGAGGTVAANTYYVVITLTDGNGETPGSPQTSVTTTGTTSSITVTHPTDPAVQNATWNVYVGTVSGGPFFSQGTALAFTANRSITATPPTTGTQAPGVDYSEQDAPQFSLTTASTVHTTTTQVNVAAGDHTVSAADVGNVYNNTGGTATAQRLEITGIDIANNRWTVDKAAGTSGQTLTGNLGGSLASPGLVGALATSTNLAFVLYSATPYAMSASTNVAGGSISATVGLMLVGYNSTRRIGNTDASRPTFQASANSVTLVSLGFGGGHAVANLILDGNGHSSVTGLSLGNTGDYARNLKLVACAVGVSVGGDSITVEDSFATGCATSYTTTGRSRFLRCDSSGATTTAISLGQIGAHAEDCILYNTTGTAISFVNQPGMITGCLIHTATANGINMGNSAAVIENTIIYGCAGTGLAQTTGRKVTDRIANCAVGGNGTDLSTNIFAEQVTALVTLTGDPCTNAAAGDFSLNNISGAGYNCRAAGLPGPMAGVSTTGYRDIGPVQHSDASAPQGPAARVVVVQNIGTY